MTLKTLQKEVESGRKAVSKFELPETQFERTVRDKIACKTNLEWENDCFKHSFRILTKFPIQYPKKNTKKFGTVRKRNGVKI